MRRFVKGRVLGIALLVPSLLLYFQVNGIKETHNCTPNAKWRVVSPEFLLRVILIFHSSPVLTAGGVKNRYCYACIIIGG